MSDADLLRRALRVGLITGIVLVYLAAVGMIEKFNTRNLVSDSLTLGRLMLTLPFFLAGYVLTRPRIRRGEWERPAAGQGVAAGLAAGAVAAGVTAASLGIVHAIGQGAVRGIFVAVTPGLLSIVEFGQELGIGALILIVAGGLLGGAGAAFRLLPRIVRHPLAVGVLVTLGAGLLQRIVPTVFREVGVSPSWLYSAVFGGLTASGAVIVFVVTVAVAFMWVARGTRVRRGIEELPRTGRRAVQLLGLAALLAVLGFLPQLIGPVLSQILGTVGIFLLMGLGLNIVVGYAGLLDLGYVAFFAAGAYITALLTGGRVVTALGEAVESPNLELSFYAALPLVILAAAVVGLLIGAPVLRLRGDYLAIVTLGFGEIARVLVTSDWLRGTLGGAQGLRDIPAAPIGGVGFRDPQNFYYLVLVLVLIAIFVSRRLADSRIGRAWNAMREDEPTAEAMGISTIKYKLLAFAMGGAVGCLSGALFAVQIGSLSPVSFNILVSIAALAIIILGGMGSIPGVVVGALVLIGLPGLLSEFEEFRLLIYGAVLIAIMILRPQGLIPNVRRLRELREEELAQDRWGRAPVAEIEVAVAEGMGDPE